MTKIVFSRDRALQLEAFLRSYEKHVTPLGRVDVLTCATTFRHQTAYDEVFGAYPFARQVKQGPSFKETLLSLLPGAGAVVFFVDDQVFVRPWNSVSVTVGMSGLSLRLAPHLRKCYPTGREQRLPDWIPNPILHEWIWSTGDGDWGYPMSLDGHVFDLEYFRLCTEVCEFSSPNTLEAALQVNSNECRYGLCYSESKVVNVPWTRVQTDCDNRFAGLSADDMLCHWEAGRRIKLGQIYGVLNESCHQEFPLVLEDR